MWDGEDDADGGGRVPDGGIRLSEIFSALENRRRRYALYVLHDAENTDLATLAERVAAWEHGLPSEDVPEEAIEVVQTSLYHNHLPKLSEAALVEYDPRSEEVRYRHPHALLDRLLGVAREFERPSEFHS